MTRDQNRTDRPKGTTDRIAYRIHRLGGFCLAVALLGLPPAASASAVFKDEFRVNEITEGRQFHGAVAADVSGRFAVVWESEVGGDFDAMIRCYDRTGEPIGDERPMHDDLLGQQRLPFIANDSAGQFIVTWSDGPEGAKWLRQRVFDSATCEPALGLQGDETTLNVDIIPGHTAAAIAAFQGGEHQGRWIVFWPQWIIHNESAELLARLYDVDGTPMTDPVRVNQEDSIALPPYLPAPLDTCTVAGENVPCLKVAPTVSVDHMGDAMFAWEHWGSNSIIRVRRMNLFADTAEDEIEINPTEDPEVYSRRPVITLSPCGTSAYLVYTELQSSYPDPSEGRSYYIAYENGQWDSRSWGVPEDGTVGSHKPYVRMAPPAESETDELVLVGWTHEQDDLFLRLEDPAVGEIGTIRVNTSNHETRQRMDFATVGHQGRVQVVACWESYQETDSFDMFCKIYRF